MKTVEERLAWVSGVCRRIGIRSTPVRQQILVFLANRRMPTSLDMIIRADGINGKFDSATVYRTLMMFKEAELVRIVGMPRTAAYFLLNYLNESGHFLICRRCGCIRELPLPPIAAAAIKRLASAHGFSMTPQDCEVYGFCHECQLTRLKSVRPSKLALRLDAKLHIVQP
jgi:Fur family ferric uptake transcriptional regulator